MKHVIDELDRVRRRARRLLAGQQVCVIAASAVGTMLAFVLLDYLLRLPSSLRLILLLVGGAVLLIAALRALRGVVSFRPSPVEIALRVERVAPSLAGRLASSVEFVTAGMDESNALAARSVREAETRLSGASMDGVMRVDRAWRAAGALAAVLIVGGLLGATNPVNARIGLERLFAPYSGAAWPARTAVASLMDEVVGDGHVHPRGIVLPLRAKNLTPDGADETVSATYRLVRDGSNGPWEEVVLTHQGSGVHERFVDTKAEAIEVWFETDDARTDIERIALEPAPEIITATARVTPPAYAERRIAETEADLGPGVDERATAERPVLIGSRVVLDITLNKPLPVPDDITEWRGETFRLTGGDTPAVLVDDESGSRWTVAWTVEAPSTLEIRLVDEYGLENRDPIVYAIDAIADALPSVAITNPEVDQTVLPGAIIDVAGEAKDDVGLALLGIDAVLERGGSATPIDFEASRTVDTATAAIESTLQLGDFELEAGDVVALTAFAQDISRDIDRELVRSTVRRLRVIGELDFAAQLRRQLGAVRQNAIRIEGMQSDLQEDLRNDGVQPGQERAQAQIADRIAAQRAAVADVTRAMEQNRLDDEALDELLRQSTDLLDFAGRAASESAEALQDATPGDEDVASDVEERQQTVRDELTDLIELLDRDEDTWIVRQRLQGMLTSQRELAERTADLAAETLGRDLEALSDAERAELDRIVQEERELVDEALATVEEMRRRAQGMESFDSNSASALRAAADTAEEQELDAAMEEAANQAELNRMQNAAAAQQDAIETLERMVEDIEETQRARAQELLRQLASLVESIERLVTLQENELMALATAEAEGDYTGRDRSLIRLSQNTRAVAADARSAGQPTRRIARLLDRAADAQGAGVEALRATPVVVEVVRESEERALTLLTDALEESKALEEQTQQDQVRQRREEIMAEYQRLAELQGDLLQQTTQLSALEALSRRDLVDARRIGNMQSEIRTALSDVQSSTNEIADSAVFRYAHELMDDWCAFVSDELWDGRVGLDVTDRQRMIGDSIARQIEALAESAQQPDEFTENSDGGDAGGGGGGQSGGAPPLIPPVAELKRLHGLQEQIHRETRVIDEREAADTGANAGRIRELGEMQQRLIEMSEALLEALTQPSGGPPAGGGQGDVP